MEDNSLKKRAQNFIIEKRKALGLNQVEFAEIVFGDKKKNKWVSKIEKGRGISLETLDKILTKLNCDIEFIEY